MATTAKVEVRMTNRAVADKLKVLMRKRNVVLMTWVMRGHGKMPRCDKDAQGDK